MSKEYWEVEISEIFEELNIKVDIDNIPLIAEKLANSFSVYREYSGETEAHKGGISESDKQLNESKEKIEYLENIISDLGERFKCHIDIGRGLIGFRVSFGTSHSAIEYEKIKKG